MESLRAEKLFRVDGMVAVITGGGTGIGRTMALTLAHNGAAKVYIAGRRKEKLDATAAEGPAGVIEPIVCDVTSKESLAAAAAHVQRRSGMLNLLVANSGVGGPQVSNLKRDATLREFKEHAWKDGMDFFTDTMHVNATAVFYTVLAFLELLDEGNRKGNMGLVKSQVVATSSLACYNRVPLAGIAYCISKAACTHLMKMLSTYMVQHEHQIRFNTLAPGLFMSELSAGMTKGAEGDPTAEGAFPAQMLPARRVGSDEDMGGSILYLTSRAGSYLNGNVLLLDGGRLSLLPATY